MDNNQLFEAAIEYASRGWSIFPLKPGLKVPLTKHGCNDATTDVKTIEAWWQRWPDANIGLLCGPVSGVYVVDVDTDDEKNVDGWGSLIALEDEHGDFTQTVRQDSPRGGAHFLYKAEVAPKNKNNFRNGIDIRSAGYYIVLAPSVHPNGIEYAWAPGMGPGDIELAEFPDCCRPENEKPALPWEKKEKPKTVATQKTSTARLDVLDRARLYVQECPAAVEGHGGHDALLWVARALVDGFELDDSSALSIMWNDYNPRCSPPWDRSKAADVKDFERKVREVRRVPGDKPRGWLLEETGLVDYLSDELVETGREWTDALLDGEKKPNKEERVKRQIVKGTDWGDLLNPPGLVGQLTGWINSGAGCYQPKLAVAASITACGALFGRKVRDISNGRTNIFAMGVAHSSAGKDHPADCIEQLFAAAGASHYLGGSRITSDSALEVALSACPVQLFCWDEVGHMFTAIKQAGAGSGGAQHLRTIVPALMSLWSSSHKVWKGKQKAEDFVRVVDQPSVSVWGLTSPDMFYAGISKAELRDGWLGRNMVVISHDRPKYEIREACPAPEHLISMVEAWANRIIMPPAGDVGDIRGAVMANQILIPTQPGAMQIFESFRDECHLSMMKANQLDDDCQFLWGKGLQNARRVALILAAGEKFDGAEITAAHAEYGCRFVRNTIIDFADAIEAHIFESVHEEKKQKLLRMITNAGREGLKKSDIVNRTLSFRDAKERDSYLDDLVQSGRVDRAVEKAKSRGRPVERYWIHPLGLLSLQEQDV